MSRPHWQQQECPDWCTVEHSDHDHADDHAHRDEGITIPVVFRRRRYEARSLIEQIVQGSIVLGRWQRDGEPQSWRFIGTDDGLEIEIAEECYRALVAEIHRTLG